MESEKVKEIKKALQESIEYCARELEKDLFQKSLTLINELESENETLHTNLCEYRKENKKLKDRIAELEKENEILKGTKDRLTFADRVELVNNAVENKLKQFAEKLKEKLEESNCINNGLWLVDTQVLIDETLKEFL